MNVAAMFPFGKEYPGLDKRVVDKGTFAVFLTRYGVCDCGTWRSQGVNRSNNIPGILYASESAPPLT